jgi:hypothetical protein
MRVEIVFIVVAAASYVAILTVGHSIAEDVNGKLGTQYKYKGIFVWKGDPWKEHQRLFPTSRKRMAVALIMLGSVSLLVLVAAMTFPYGK